MNMDGINYSNEQVKHYCVNSVVFKICKTLSDVTIPSLQTDFV